MRKLALSSLALCCLALVLVWPAQASAKGKAKKRSTASSLLGCWLEAKPATTRLILNVRSGYLWEGKFGLWKIKGNRIWLVGKRMPNGKRFGVLWRMRIKAKAKGSRWLTFFKPEEFVYHGRGRYTYMRFRSPKTKRRFRFEKKLRPCLLDYVKRQKQKKAKAKARQRPPAKRK